MKKLRIIAASLLAAVGLAMAAAPSHANHVPMHNYWNEGVREDAIQWCEVHSYVGGVKVYQCLYNQPSCAWAGVPYPGTRGSCAMNWTMWPRVRNARGKYCIGRADYVYTRNVTTFKVDCYSITPI